MKGHIELAMAEEWETSVLNIVSGPDPDPSVESPQCVGKYQLRGLLGKGAMGAVHRAFDPVLEREVAVKLMLPRIADDPEHKRRFEREARAVARMSHPNVVTVFDLGYHTDGSPYIVMELLRGHDLNQVLRSEPALSPERKIGVVLQVLAGLGHAHRAGIVHRDVKPANIFIVEGGTAKVMDFGVAHLPAASGVTAGVMVGTANYMAPEQVLGARVDGRSDLFGVGCMLAEMLTGRPPFQAETAMSTLYRVAHQEPHLPLPEGPESEPLRAILQRTLAKAPEARFASAEDLAAVLRDCLGSAAEAPPLRSGHLHSRPTGKAAAPPPAASTPTQAADPAGICRLLREVYLGSRSGHLHFSHADEHRSLRMLQGRIVHATSDVAGEHLGDVLVRYGRLSQANLDRAVAQVLGQRKRLGTVLSEMGLIEPLALAAAVGDHVREILFGALERANGNYVFEDMPDTAIEADLTCELTTGEAILEATRRVVHPALIEQALGDMKRVLVPASDARLKEQKVTLTPTDGFVLSRIDGTLSAREMLRLVPGSQEDAARSLFGLLCTGLVNYKTVSPGRSRPARPSPLATAGASAPPPRRSPRPPIFARAAARELDGEALREMIVSAYEGLRYRDHFEVLGLPRAATEDEIREAYSRLVRIFHPDACQDPVVADLVTERGAVLARLCQAYETLRCTALRATYEREVAPVKRRPSLSRRDAAAPADPQPTPPSPPASRPPVAEEVPDRDKTRADPLAAATRLVKQEKYWDAIQLLEPAIPLLVGPPRHRARVLLAQAYLKNPHWSKRAEAVLLAVVAEAPNHVDAHLLLAGLYLKTRLEARAAAMFGKVLELQPSHLGAAAGLKALQAPQEASFRLPFLKRA